MITINCVDIIEFGIYPKLIEGILVFNSKDETVTLVEKEKYKEIDIQQLLGILEDTGKITFLQREGKPLSLADFEFIILNSVCIGFDGKAYREYEIFEPKK
jgi:hypothetical protein